MHPNKDHSLISDIAPLAKGVQMPQKEIVASSTRAFQAIGTAPIKSA
jgi:hypothetical protein